MNEFVVRPSSKANIDSLVQELSQMRVAHSDNVDERYRVVGIGPDNDYEIRMEKKRIGTTRATILIRYEHPVVKKLITDWIEKCALTVHDDFYAWQMSLSPTVIRGIKDRWSVDLSALSATPVKLGQFVLVFMFSKNVTSEIAAQLASFPHRSMAKDEFVKSAEFSLSGDDPFDTVVYGWRSAAGSQLFAVTASAPAMTILSLWVISEGAPVEHNIQPFPNPNQH